MSMLDRIMGTKPEDPAQHGLPAIPEGAPRGREARGLLAAEQLEQLRILSQQMTSMAAQLQGFLTNGVLAVETVAIDASATPTHRQFKAEIGAITLRNLGAVAMTVFAGGPSSFAPTSGRGIWVVPPAERETIAISGTQFTVYGAAGDRFCFAAFTLEARPAS